MRWSDIITDKQDNGQVDNNAAMMGIAFEKDIEQLQKADVEQAQTGDHGSHGQAPITGKGNDTVSVDSFSSKD